MKFIVPNLFKFTEKRCSLSAAPSRRYECTDLKSPLITPIPEAKRFIKDCLEALETPPETAKIIAENLLTADVRGHFKYGMKTLESYVNKIKENILDPKSLPIVLKENANTALVEGLNGFGIYTAKYCMDLALKKMQNSDLSIIASKGLDTCGMLTLHTLKAINFGMLGICMEMSPPLSTGDSKDNLIAIGIPEPNSYNFLFDLDLKNEENLQKLKSKEKQQLINWAYSELDCKKQCEEFKKETHIENFIKIDCKKECSGFQQTGLGQCLDLLSELIDDTYKQKLKSKEIEFKEMYQTYIVLDPKFFGPNFKLHISDLLNDLQNLPQSIKPILMMKGKEELNLDKVIKEGGIIYDSEQHLINKKLAEDLGVAFMKSHKKSEKDNK